MATYVDNHDACTGDMVPTISQFNPYLLSKDNWMQTIVDLGAKYAVLVAKVDPFSANTISISVSWHYSMLVDFCYHPEDYLKGSK